MIDDKKSCFVLMQVRRDFNQFQFIEPIRARVLIKGKETDVLNKAQELSASESNPGQAACLCTKELY